MMMMIMMMMMMMMMAMIIYMRLNAHKDCDFFCNETYEIPCLSIMLLYFTM